MKTKRAMVGKCIVVTTTMTRPVKYRLQRGRYSLNKIAGSVPQVNWKQQPAISLLYSIEEIFIFFIHYFPNTVFPTSFSDNQIKVRKLFKVSLYLAQGNAHVLRHLCSIDLRRLWNQFIDLSLSLYKFFCDISVGFYDISCLFYDIFYDISMEYLIINYIITQ